MTDRETDRDKDRETQTRQTERHRQDRQRDGNKERERETHRDRDRVYPDSVNVSCPFHIAVTLDIKSLTIPQLTDVHHFWEPRLPMEVLDQEREVSSYPGEETIKST